MYSEAIAMRFTHVPMKRKIFDEYSIFAYKHKSSGDLASYKYIDLISCVFKKL